MAREALRGYPQETRSEESWGCMDRDHTVVIPHILYRLFLHLSNEVKVVAISAEAHLAHQYRELCFYRNFLMLSKIVTQIP